MIAVQAKSAGTVQAKSAGKKAQWWAICDHPRARYVYRGAELSVAFFVAKDCKNAQNIKLAYQEVTKALARSYSNSRP